MEFLPFAIQQYAEQHSEEEPAILQQLARETHLKVLLPRMLSGHFQGRFLSFISKLIQPKNILEIGTYTGYSAICLAEGLSINGQLITIDVNEERAELVNRYIELSENKDKIIPYIGKALEIIPLLNSTFDLVFIDADKLNYIHYFEMVIDKVRSGGIIIIDNVLWSGKVTEKAKQNDAETLLLQQLNLQLKNDNRIEVLLLPIRDGLSLVRKK
jgi:predicted O-methyltransferase YrrM